MVVFDDVPDWLVEKVRGMPSHKEREVQYLNAAGWVIAYYLGKDVTREFYLPAIEFEGALWHRHVNSVILIADTLFRMRFEPGFNEFCRRLRHKDMRAKVFEIMAAKQFLKAGYHIHARPETGIKGQDYDFWAMRDVHRVNVEVTALTAKRYSRNTVLGALRKKRSQLPNDAASVIFCAIPDTWLVTDPGDWNFRLMTIAHEFLRGTRRVNVVLFWVEQAFDLNFGKAGGGLVYVGNAHVNIDPYFPFDTSMFFGGIRYSVSAISALTETAIDDIISIANSTDFFRWVEHIVDTAHGKNDD